MASSPIWKKHARVSFSKTVKIEVFEKVTSVRFFLLIICIKKLCSHVRKSHLEINKIKKFEK